ncbi:ABC transporter ATP-binding protein [Thioalkalivibrio sp.]|uniref:ABC transporter ATP-binding protein n=1 Tax=Thioalkalivibrio sp. TaxID=2093813 RepID=UPI00356614D0
MEAGRREPLIRVRGLVNRFGSTTVHQGLDLDVWPGEILGVVGGSGAGKTVLLRALLSLRQPQAGSVTISGDEMVGVAESVLRRRRQRIGMLFQNGALFGGLSLLDNISFPLREHTRLSRAVIEELALIKLRMAGLDAKAANLFPNELSGGMVRRGSLARALIMDPELLILDEPTAGLDPVNAANFDELILDLKSLLGLTVLLVTHDLDSLWRITDRVVFLGDGRVLEEGSVEDMSRSEIPQVASYFKQRRKH